ncbi:MAG TPA: polysaccharide biosynthesis tyrosine autokinase [Bryobacteraceae bacterium]|nr:polysaccharide biosynthesis tyrosine autokinase [Bryobacteraceae bacterium]
MEIRLLNDADDPMRWGAHRVPGPPPPQDEESQEGSAPVDVFLLLRRYWLVLVILVFLGGTGGLVTLLYSLPTYNASATIEVIPLSEVWLRNSLDITSFESNEVNLQTQLNILRSGRFRRRGAERVQSEVIPLPPPVRGVLSRLREHFQPSTRDPVESTRRALDMAIGTFDARPVNRTRLIELSCESTSPQVAASFLNSMAAEFVEDTSRSHSQSSQKTNELLATQIEETKTKLHDTEERLRTFVQASGNLFAGQDISTLADLQLTQAKQRLTEAHSQVIAAQTRYELSTRVPPESLTEVQLDSTLRGYQDRIGSLNQQRAALLITMTEKNEKVRLIDAQIVPLQEAYQRELAAVLKKIHDDYDAALREEKHRADDYASKSQRVGSEASKASQYAELKREVETLRQQYQTLIGQANQAEVTNASSINPVRIIEPSTPPPVPYKPRPLFNLSLGSFVGLLAGCAFVFLRERTDRSVRSPGSMRRWLNTPELGVIPNLSPAGYLEAGMAPNAGNALIPVGSDELPSALANWRSAPAFVTESFRGTLASILRIRPGGRPLKVLLVTSPGPGEGKTTVVQNLGIALAETGRKVLLVDGDFRRPHLHKRFHLPNTNSLIDSLGNEGPLEPELMGVSTGIPGLFILPNRATDSHVARALYSPKLRTFFSKLREAYDMVLVDAPPFLHLADARIIAPLTDGAVLVLRSGATSREHAVEAYRRMREDGLFLLGTILTAWEASNSYLKRHYYYYDYADENRKR